MDCNSGAKKPQIISAEFGSSGINFSANNDLKSRMNNHLKHSADLYRQFLDGKPYEEQILDYGKYFFSRTSIIGPRSNTEFIEAVILGSIYCEGFVLCNDHPLPIFHRWLVEPLSDYVIDGWVAGRLYFGVEFQADYVVSVLGKTANLGIFEFDLNHGQSILRDGLPQDAIAKRK